MKAITILLIILSFLSFGQENQSIDNDLFNIQTRHSNMAKTSMISLNTWAIGNITYGTIANFNSAGEAKYFHQMNAIWNVVNLGIGIPGIIGAYKTEETKTLKELYDYQHKIEKVYFINSGLDLAYIASGLALRNFGEQRTGEARLRLKGYGNSLMMQGGYLLVHDIAMLIMYKSNVKLLDAKWKNVKITSYGLNLKIEL